MNVIAQNDYIEFTANLNNEDEPWSITLWSPTNPALYDVSFVLTDRYGNVDSVETYFGMRKISIQGDKVLLNNVPLYQRLVLDQGYWEESHLTSPSDEAIIKDIDLILAAGYNGVRKHQKIEDRRFLYWCDKKGLLVRSEMAAGYTFNDEAIHN
jgi:beta-galactosidase/beta-glucuronidase